MEYSANETTEKKKYKQLEPGTYTGVCYMVADIGTQDEVYEGEASQKRKVIIGWETPEELTDDGKPLSVIKTYTLSLNEKATLAKDYKAWVKDSNPKTFNLGALIGKGCNLAIGQTSGGNAKVLGVTALKASEKVPPVSVDTILYDLRAPVGSEFEKLPQFIKDKILLSPEYKQHILSGGKPTIADKLPKAELDDSIPF